MADPATVTYGVLVNAEYPHRDLMRYARRSEDLGLDAVPEIDGVEQRQLLGATGYDVEQVLERHQRFSRICDCTLTGTPREPA